MPRQHLRLLRLPAPGLEITGDLRERFGRVEFREGRDLGGAYHHAVHLPKQPFAPGEVKYIF